MGAAWFCTHIWNHYLYTSDGAFLKEMYPIMREAVLFFQDFLIEDQGELVTCPSISPENTYILENRERGCVCARAAMDSQILRHLLEGFLKASKECVLKAYRDYDGALYYQGKCYEVKIKKGQILNIYLDRETERGVRPRSHWQ